MEENIIPQDQKNIQTIEAQKNISLVQPQELKATNEEQEKYYVMDFIPDSKRKKGKMELIELLYGDHYVPNSKNKVQRNWRKTFLVTLFVSMLFRAYEKIKKMGAVRSIAHVEKYEKQKEDENQKIRKAFIIYPTDGFKHIWNIVMVIILISVGLFTPFRVCFVEQDTDGWIILDYIFDFIFVCDMIVTFTGAYFDANGKLIDDHKKIAWAYISGWFLIDFIAIFPINLLLADNSQQQGDGGTEVKLLRLVRLPRLYRLLRLLKLGKGQQDIKKKLIVMRFLNMLNINEGFIKVLFLLINILFLNHLVACFWHFLAKFEDFNENTWVYRAGLLDKSLTARYVASFYWSFQTLTTVGYGDIAPQTVLEMIYSMLWMFFGVGFFSYTLGNLSAIMSSIDKKTAEYNKKVNQFNDFALKVKLPIEIRNKIHTYYQNNFYKMMYKSLDPSKMIQELPTQLKKDLLLYCYEFLKDEISIFKIDPNFTADMVQHLYYFEAEKGDVIYREGDHPEEVYFLGTGKVNLVNDSGKVICGMVEGCFFGEIEVVEDIKRKHFAVAEQSCNLYFCKKDIFLDQINEFPAVKAEVMEIIKRRKEKYQICKLILQSQQDPKYQNVKKETLKRSTEHYLNMLISYKEKALKKKKYKIRIFQSQKEREDEEKEQNEKNQKELEQMRANLSSSYAVKKTSLKKINVKNEGEEQKEEDDEDISECEEDDEEEKQENVLKQPENEIQQK